MWYNTSMNTTDIQTRQVNYDLENEVVMANDMIRGISRLSLNESKLLRLIIMQVKPHDKELMQFSIKISEFAEILGVGRRNMYREADRMTDRLMQEVIRIGDGNPKHRWKKFHWVDVCEYEDGTLTIKVSDELKPYLLGLQKWYTQYRLEDIFMFKSVYAIRMFELITMGLKDAKPYANNVTEVYIPISVIRKATNTEDKYERISQFKAKVISTATRDINEFSPYHVTVRDYKEGKKIVGFYFTVSSRTRNDDIEEPDFKQMSIEDYMTK